MDISPNKIIINSINEITINGENFQDGCIVKINNILATDIMFISINQVKCKNPSISILGKYNVTVINPDLQEFIITDGLEVIKKPNPIITNITPNWVYVAETKDIVLNGEYFENEMDIKFRTINTKGEFVFTKINEIKFVNENKLEFVNPIILKDSKTDIYIKTLTSDEVVFNEIFEYRDNTTPIISSISPNYCYLNETKQSTIVGNGFKTGCIVKFKNNTEEIVLKVVSQTETQIIVDIPSYNTQKTFELIITNPNLKVGSKPNAFSYIKQDFPSPKITSISKDFCYLNETIDIDIFGNDFRNGCSVRFNDVNASNIRFINSSKLTVSVPISTIEKITSIYVKNDDGREDILTNSFRYIVKPLPKPIPTSVIPNNCFVEEQIKITINGSNFVNGCLVYLDGVKANNVIFKSSNLIEANIPLLTYGGVLDIEVTNPDNQTGILANSFTIKNKEIPPIPKPDVENPTNPPKIPDIPPSDVIINSDTIEENTLQYRIILHKPNYNRDKICEMHEIQNINFKNNLNGVTDEMDFEINFDSSENHRIKDNFVYVKALEKYTISVTNLITNKIQYYQIIDTEETGSFQKDFKKIRCLSFEHVLSKKMLRTLEGTFQLYKTPIYYSFDNVNWYEYITPINANGRTHIYAKTKDYTNINEYLADKDIVISQQTINHIIFDIHTNTIAPFNTVITLQCDEDAESGNGVLNELESEWNWKVGYIDPDIRYDVDKNGIIQHRKYRTFSISDIYWLNFIREDLSKAFSSDKLFDCIITFDTQNRLININKMDNIGKNTGLVLSEYNYMNSITKKVDVEKLTTKLYVDGKNGLTIADWNLWGTEYIYNFDYFMNDGYMSLDLRNQIITYNAFALQKQTEFNALLTSKNAKDKELQVLNVQISRLNTDMKAINNYMDVLIRKGRGTQDDVEYAEQTNLKFAKQVEIDAKQLEINNKQSEIYSIQTQIKNIAKALKLENNFTTEAYRELVDVYIIEDKYSDEFASTSQEMYDRCKQFLIEKNKPILEITLDNIRFNEITECKYDAKKLKLGDIINVEYSRLNIKVEMRLIMIEHSPFSSLKLTFSTLDKKIDMNRNRATLQRKSDSNTNTFLKNKFIWDESLNNTDAITKIRTQALDASAQTLRGGHNKQDVRIDDRGIYLSDMTNENLQVGMIAGCMAFTSDGWLNADLAITNEGIVAKSLIGKIIAGNKLEITNETGSFSVNSDSVNITNLDLNLTRQNDRILLNPSVGLKMQRLGNDGVWQDNFYVNNIGEIVAKNFTSNDSLTGQYIKFNSQTLSVYDGDSEKLRLGWSPLQGRNTSSLLIGSIGATYNYGFIYYDESLHSLTLQNIYQDGSIDIVSSNINLRGLATVNGWEIANKKQIDDINTRLVALEQLVK